MEIIDISRTISGGMEVYPGDPKVTIEVVKTIDNDGSLLSKISMGLHTGTHMDAPAHYIKWGKTIESTKPIVEHAKIIEGKIERKDLSKGEVLLIKGRKEITDKEAETIIEAGVAAVGIDSLSIGSDKIHKRLLSESVPIIEGLDLSKAKPGKYKMICLPLKIKGAEAAPARCILIK